MGVDMTDVGSIYPGSFKAAEENVLQCFLIIRCAVFVSNTRGSIAYDFAQNIGSPFFSGRKFFENQNASSFSKGHASSVFIKRSACFGWISAGGFGVPVSELLLKGNVDGAKRVNSRTGRAGDHEIC